MWARRPKSGKRNSHGIAPIRRDSYNTQSGFATKAGWWQIRNEVWARDKGRCIALVNGKPCGKPGSEVHHIVALSKGGTTTKSNLMTICTECHDRRHNHLFKASLQNRRTSK